MRIEDYTRLREYRYYRRATFWIVLLDAAVLLLLVGLIWLTCTHFLDTSLSEGLARLTDWVRGGAR